MHCGLLPDYRSSLWKLVEYKIYIAKIYVANVVGVYYLLVFSTYILTLNSLSLFFSENWMEIKVLFMATGRGVNLYLVA